MSDDSDAIDQALTTQLGLHGPWILAVEVIDPDTGEQVLRTISPAMTSWTRLGLARTLALRADQGLLDGWEPDDD